MTPTKSHLDELFLVYHFSVLINNSTTSDKLEKFFLGLVVFGIIPIPKEFPTTTKVFKTKRIANSSEVRDKLKNEDFTAFKKLVPPCVSSLYATLVSGVHNGLNQSSKK